MAPVKTDGFDTNVSEAAGFTSNNLNVIVSSDDPALVASTTEDVLAALSDRDDLINLKSDLVTATPEIRITVDPNRAMRRRHRPRPRSPAKCARPCRRPSRRRSRSRARPTRSTSSCASIPRPSRASRTSTRCRRNDDQGAARPDRDRRAGRRPGQHHPDRPGAGRPDHRRDRRRKTPARCRRRSPSRSMRSWPTARSRTASR